MRTRRASWRPRRLVGRLFLGLFALGCRLALTPGLRLFTAPLMGTLGRLTAAVRRARRRDGIEAVAREWQRMFPRPADVPLLGVEDDVAYAEIHTVCPLRGTGDVGACHRVMQYDRSMLRTIGGSLVVLRSQAEPGVEICRVAIGKAAP